MPLIQSIVQIDAPPEHVYEVLTNSAYIIKIFRDAISVTVDPPGKSVVGQKYHMIARAGRRKIEIHLRLWNSSPTRRWSPSSSPAGYSTRSSR